MSFIISKEARIRSNLLYNYKGKDHIEMQFLRKKVNEEGYEWCSISSTTAQEKDGKIAAFVTEIRSIDDVIRREEQQQQALAAAIEQAQLANRQKVIFYLV